MYLLIGFLAVMVILTVIAIVKGFFRFVKFLAFVAVVGIGFYFVQTRETQQPTEPKIEQTKTISDYFKDLFGEVTSQSSTPQVDNSTVELVERLTGSEQSSLDENGQPVGSAKYGATLILGDLDQYGRATYGHILVSDAQEPGQNGEDRPGKITVDPADWKNYKFNNVWVNDRTHTIGFQFGGVNSDERVLTTAGAYLNRGTEGKGSDQDNPDSMLYYEQRLDSWLATHPNFKLDLYVKPIYEGTSGVVKQMYMQWVGVDSNNETIVINIGGKSQQDGDYSYVVLDNVFPNLNIDYQTGYVTKK